MLATEKGVSFVKLVKRPHKYPQWEESEEHYVSKLKLFRAYLFHKIMIAALSMDKPAITFINRETKAVHQTSLADILNSAFVLGDFAHMTSPFILTRDRVAIHLMDFTLKRPKKIIDTNFDPDNDQNYNQTFSLQHFSESEVDVIYLENA